jgi:hypothetical protein
MSVALSDFLVELADPYALQNFRKNPELFMNSHPGLTDADKAAIRSGRAALIRTLAVVTDSEVSSDAPYRQYTNARVASFNPALIEIDPQVHIDLTNNGMTAIHGNQLFIDKHGRLFRIAPVSGVSA